eukprot:3148258-Pyramimonas_sp.AAC.1
MAPATPEAPLDDRGPPRGLRGAQGRLGGREGRLLGDEQLAPEVVVRVASDHDELDGFVGHVREAELRELGDHGGS